MNQRKIKFRAWNIEKGLWYGKLGKPFTIQNAMIADWSTPTTELVFMQYTGLKDKNSVEVYEGDIVRHTQTNEIVSIKWHGTMAGFIYQRPDDGKPHGTNDRWGELFRMYGYYEVIGNIYENPELIKGAK